MNSLQSTLTSVLPAKRKQTPSGWISFDAPCCVHNGESADTRKRGGIIFNGDGSISYHCFNCGYTGSYTPGRNLSHKMRKLLKWFGVSDSEITRLSLEAMRTQQLVDVEHVHRPDIPLFEERQLPEGAVKIADMQGTDQFPESLIEVAKYIHSRSIYLDEYDFYWTNKIGYKDRLIVPFYYHNKIVGYTARKIVAGKPKYITDSQPGYVFNLDHQHPDRKFVVVVEGPFDAIAVDGVAVLGFEVNDTQANLINALGKQVIVVPDRDQSGKGLVNEAVKYGWAVSFPNWYQDEIKDVNDAVQHYGKIYTLKKILDSVEQGTLKQELLAKTYFA